MAAVAGRAFHLLTCLRGSALGRLCRVGASLTAALPLVLASSASTTAGGRYRTLSAQHAADLALSNAVGAAVSALEEGENARAEQLLESALERSLQIGARAGVISTFDMLATLAYRRGDAARAEQLLRRALFFMLSQLRLPRDHEQVLSFELKLARLFVDQGRTKEAEDAFKRCEALCRRRLPPGALPAASEALAAIWVSALFWHGWFLLGQRKPADAAPRLLEAYRAAVTAPAAATVPEQRLVILYHLADALQQAGYGDHAVSYLQTAVSLDGGSSDSDVATCCVKLGNLLAVRGEEEFALALCEKGTRLAARARNRQLASEGRLCVQELRAAVSAGHNTPSAP